MILINYPKCNALFIKIRRIIFFRIRFANDYTFKTVIDKLYKMIFLNSLLT